MKDRVPTDGQISEAVSAALRRHRRIESQKELRTLTVAELGRLGYGTQATAVRIRKVAINSGAAEVEIEYRASQSGLPDVCPVCGSAMDSVKGVGLDGGVREIRRGCSSCPFTVSGKPKGPAKYIFTAPRRPVSDADLRIRKLKRAAGMLVKAGTLISEAVEGTELSSRTDFSENGIENIISSKEESGSINNLIADLKDREDPLWTRPFYSPKRPKKSRRPEKVYHYARDSDGR